MSKSKYVDGFVLKVTKKNVKEYQKIAKYARKAWLSHGALEYREAVSDDINVDFGIPFAKLTNLKKNEVVFFSWITYKSKTHRNAVNAKVMNDPKLAKYMDPQNMPFDVNLISYGGFKIVVSE